MEILTFFKTSLGFLFVFLRDNFTNIAIGLGAILLFYVASFLTLASLKKLRVDIFSYYPFDRFLPKSGKWSALYFITLLLFLGFLIFFLLKGMFYGKELIISTAS